MDLAMAEPAEIGEAVGKTCKRVAAGAFDFVAQAKLPVACQPFVRLA
jgi:hypothetical protein